MNTSITATRLSLYVREKNVAGTFRFNACFPSDDKGLPRAVAEANWYKDRGYIVILVETPDTIVRYNPPIVWL